MRRRTTVPAISLLFVVFGFTGCGEADVAAPENAMTVASPAFAAGGPNPRPETWVDGERFGGIVTRATFKPSSGRFDELYAGGNGFRDGVPLISESKPGDQDYNGGRWHLNTLKPGVDPNKYANADRVEDLDPNDFESTDSYFECPLLPRRENQ